MYDWDEKIKWNKSKNPDREITISSKTEDGYYRNFLFILKNGDAYSDEQIEDIVENVYKRGFNKGYRSGEGDKLIEIKGALKIPL